MSAPFDRATVDSFVDLLQEGAAFFVRWTAENGLSLDVRTPDGKLYRAGSIATLEFCQAVARLDAAVGPS